MNEIQWLLEPDYDPLADITIDVENEMHKRMEQIIKQAGVCAQEGLLDTVQAT